MEEPRPVTSRQNRVRFGVLALLTLVLLGLLIHGFGGAGAFYAAVRGASLPFVLASFGAATVCVLLGALRWVLVLRAVGYALSYGRSLRVLFAVWPLGLVTPSRANELLRAFAVRDVIPLPAAAGSVLAEKAVDVLVLLLMAATGAAWAGLWAIAGVLAGGAAAELVILGALMKSRRRLLALPLLQSRAAKLELLFDAFGALTRAPRWLCAVGAVSITIRVLTVVITHALLLAVGTHVSFGLTLQLWPAAMMAGLLPITMAGMGTRDAAFLYLVHRAGASIGQASLLAATVGYSVVAIWSFGIIGLPFMIREGMDRRRTAEA